MLEIALHDGAEAAPLHDGILSIWLDAFGPVGPEWTSSPWNQHRARDVYRLVSAHIDDELVGFAWGYTGQRGQFWTDLVSTLDAVRDWVGGHFEFVELAVRPEFRGRGVGGALHDALLDGIPHSRALLSTTDDPVDPAVRLYRSRGWVSLSHLDDHQVMGLVLTSVPSN